MRKLILLVFVAIIFSACNQNKKNSSGNDASYTLTGKLAGLGNDTIFLVHRTDEATITDTAVAKGDSFSFSGKCPLPRVYTLQWYRKGERHRSEIFMENAAIVITGNADSTDNIVISGSATQKKYDKYLALVKPKDEQMDSLENYAASLNEEKNKEELEAIDIAYDILGDQKKNMASDFIAANRSSQVSSFVALRNFATEAAEVGQLDSIFKLLGYHCAKRVLR